MKEIQENQEKVGSKVETQAVKENYESPAFESHIPLKIMSKWDDQSSDLPF